MLRINFRHSIGLLGVVLQLLSLFLLNERLSVESSSFSYLRSNSRSSEEEGSSGNEFGQQVREELTVSNHDLTVNSNKASSSERQKKDNSYGFALISDETKREDIGGRTDKALESSLDTRNLEDLMAEDASGDTNRRRIALVVKKNQEKGKTSLDGMAIKELTEKTVIADTTGMKPKNTTRKAVHSKMVPPIPSAAPASNRFINARYYDPVRKDDPYPPPIPQVPQSPPTFSPITTVPPTTVEPSTLEPTTSEPTLFTTTLFPTSILTTILPTSTSTTNVPTNGGGDEVIEEIEIEEIIDIEVIEIDEEIIEIEDEDFDEEEESFSVSEDEIEEESFSVSLSEDEIEEEIEIEEIIDIEAIDFNEEIIEIEDEDFDEEEESFSVSEDEIEEESFSLSLSEDEIDIDDEEGIEIEFNRNNAIFESAVLTFQEIPGVCNGPVNGVGCASVDPDTNEPGGNPNAIVNCFNINEFEVTIPLQLESIRFWIGESAALPPDLRINVYAGTQANGPMDNIILYSEELSGYVLGENLVDLDTPLLVFQEQFCVGVASIAPDGGLRIKTDVSGEMDDGSYLKASACGINEFQSLNDVGLMNDFCIEAFVSNNELRRRRRRYSR